MNEQAPKNPYPHFEQLPTSLRALFSGALMVVGLGYLFAALYVFAAHSGADGEPGLSVEDIKITYSGSSETTALEKALRGPMSGMLPQRDLETLIGWIHEGAGKREFKAGIELIIETNCLSCHDGSNPHLSNLDGYENVAVTVEQDTGTDLYTLVRVSHIHLFGLTFIFFIVGFIFSHAHVRPPWLKILLIVAPFAGVIADVLGWYVTKVFTPFAWIVLIAGFVNGIAFAAMWTISMYQMWLSKAYSARVA
ncbi:MAG: elongation factor-1 alpha [Gammaproteobacteria bacterium]|nr:elongation factor-1 alpha [Gammaproteobacteria bacterium]NNK33740.1 elongation factor-1 alpha [Xanthomonadales bacterium]